MTELEKRQSRLVKTRNQLYETQDRLSSIVDLRRSTGERVRALEDQCIASVRKGFSKRHRDDLECELEDTQDEYRDLDRKKKRAERDVEDLKNDVEDILEGIEKLETRLLMTPDRYKKTPGSKEQARAGVVLTSSSKTYSPSPLSRTETPERQSAGVVLTSTKTYSRTTEYRYEPRRNTQPEPRIRTQEEYGDSLSGSFGRRVASLGARLSSLGVSPDPSLRQYASTPRATSERYRSSGSGGYHATEMRSPSSEKRERHEVDASRQGSYSRPSYRSYDAEERYPSSSRRDRSPREETPSRSRREDSTRDRPAHQENQHHATEEHFPHGVYENGPTSDHGRSRSNRPPSPPVPSPSAIQAWRNRVDSSLADLSSMTAFPTPPGGRCDDPNCQTTKMGPCVCNVEASLRSSGVDLKKERNRWHPDKFSRCREGKVVEFKELAEEMFTIVGGMWEREREGAGGE